MSRIYGMGRRHSVAAGLLAACALILGACADGSLGPSCASATPLTAGNDFTVLTYNIRVGAGRANPGVPPADLRRSGQADDAAALSAIAAAIRESGADIVALQEVMDAEQAVRLADVLGMHHVFAHHATSRWHGVALLSRRPLRAVGQQPVGAVPERYRTALHAVVEVASQPVTLVVVHVNRRDKSRQAFEDLRDMIAALPPPVVLAGDLNVRPHAAQLVPLGGRLCDSITGAAADRRRDVGAVGTFHENSKRIDYVFVETAHFAVTDVGLIGESHRDASDHIGYWARLRLLPHSDTIY